MPALLWVLGQRTLHHCMLCEFYGLFPLSGFVLLYDLSHGGCTPVGPTAPHRGCNPSGPYNVPPIRMLRKAPPIITFWLPIAMMLFKHHNMFGMLCGHKQTSEIIILDYYYEQI